MGSEQRRLRGRRVRARAAWLLIAAVLASATVWAPAASAEPTSSPPGRIVVPWGNAPRFCAADEPGGRSPFMGALWGVAWSPVSERWVETPVCTYRWGYISLSPSGAVADSGQSVTFTMSDSVAAPYIPRVGGASWTGVPAGSVLSGCGSFDISCTFRVERSIDNRFEWQYRIIGLSAPASFVTSPIAADGWRHCSEATPCPYLTTNVWAAVAIPPEGDEPPVPNITAAPTGAEGEWRLDSSATWVAPGTEIGEWEWTIPGVGTRSGQVVNEVIPREQLPATVRLEVTTTSGRTVSTSAVVDDAVSIRAVEVEPEPVVAGAAPATATVRVRNDGAWTLSDVAASLSSTTPDLARVRSGPEPPTTSLAPGAEGELTFELVGLGRGTASLSASVSARDGARTLTDGPRTRSVEVAAPALFLQLEADPGPAAAGEPFELRAILTNTGDTELTAVEVRGEATSEDAGMVRVSPPSPSTVASLAPGARATVTYQVTSGPGRVRFEATATGTDAAVGAVTSNTDWLDKEVSGAVLTGAVAQRSGVARGSAKGGELVTLTGRGLSEFTHVDIERPDGELIASVPVETAGADELTFVTPSTVSWLDERADGSLELLADLIARVDDPEAPDGRVTTNSVGFEFSGPIIGTVTSQRSGEAFASALAPTTPLVVEGRALIDVEAIAVFVAGTDRLIEVVDDVAVVDDRTLSFTAPSVADLLEPADDGTSTLEVDVYAFWVDDEGPDGLVRSNAGAFEFRGPSIDRISFSRSGGARGALRGDEVLDIVGEGFGASDDGSVRRVSVSFRDDRTGEEAIVPAAVIDDDTVRVASTPVWPRDLPGAIGPDGSWRLDGQVRVLVPPEGDGDAEPLVSNAVPFEVLGPVLDDVTGQRTGRPVAAANGNDELTLRGVALEDVDVVYLHRRGGDQILASVPLGGSTGDPSELTFDAPRLTRFLEVGPDGSASVDVDVVAAVEVGGLTVASQRIPVEFVGPSLTEAVTRWTREPAADAAARLDLELTGELLVDVTEVHVLRTVTGELLEVLEVQEYVGDSGVIVSAPRMVRHLRSGPDGVSDAEVTMRAVYRDPAAPDGRVASDEVPFAFRGPRLDSIESSRGQPGRSPVVGGDEWLLEGSWLGGVDRIWLFARGDRRSPLRSGTLQNLGPEGLRYAARSLVADLGPSAEELELEVLVGYLDERAPGGMVLSNPLPWTLEPPVITGLEVVGTSNADLVELRLEGRFLDEAQWVGYGARDGRAVLLPAPTRSDTSMRVTLEDVWEHVTQLEDGTVGARFELFLGIDDARRPGGLLTSNTVVVEVVAGASATTVTERARAGERRVEVSSNRGWEGGDYARLRTPEGDVVRRVTGVGSLLFGAPLPTDVAEGTIVVEVDPPSGDLDPPVVRTTAGRVSLGAEATVGYTCDDRDGVGVEGCVGSVPDGTPIDTSVPGTLQVDVEAWDRNGNAVTRSLVYVVAGEQPQPSTDPPAAAPPGVAPASPLEPAEQVLGSTAGPGGGPAGRPAGSSLALTGGDPGAAPVVALGLVLLGLLLVGLARRRPPTTRSVVRASRSHHRTERGLT